MRWNAIRRCKLVRPWRYKKCTSCDDDIKKETMLVITVQESPYQWTILDGNYFYCFDCLRKRWPSRVREGMQTLTKEQIEKIEKRIDR